ncbi:GDSL esterase/lipase At5g55050-like [Apium graveolens]|uniref:GDSL esterase/lipase At5g55050-like n=1 Tax=Apium graveolens TaxID=4045 RepID=UPI003D79E9A3
MRNAKIYFYLYLNVFAVMFSSNIYTYEATSSVPAMYVFGDSLADVGNNNYINSSPYKSNFPHNGIDFPTGATGRFSNGKNAADLIADKLDLPSPLPYLSILKFDYKKTILTGVSFASGGSGILRGSYDTPKRCISLSKQVEFYSSVYKILVQELGSDAARNHLSKSLFAIVIGSNDLYGHFKANSSIRTNITPQNYVNSMVSSMSEILKQLYGLGARKFVITGVPALGCIPEQRVKSTTLACNKVLNFWARKYNYGLASALQAFKSKFNNTNYSYLDTYGAVAEFIQNPNKYGFTEIRAACCGSGELRANSPCIPTAQYCLNRDNHIYWDFYHPTQKTSSIFIDMFYNGSQYVTPISLSQLVSL